MTEKICLLYGRGELSLAELPAEARLDAAGGMTLRAAGSSMSPAICEGDLLTVIPAEVLAPGDVVVFRDHGSLVCHRVKEIRPDGLLVTQGDNVSDADAPVARAEVVGKVGAVERRPRPSPCGAALRRALRAILAGFARVPGVRPLLSLAVPRCCRYFAASRVPIKLIEAYSLVELDLAKPPPQGVVLVARLLGRNVARLNIETGGFEVHELLAGIGLEEELRRLASRNGI